MISPNISGISSISHTLNSKNHNITNSPQNPKTPDFQTHFSPKINTFTIPYLNFIKILVQLSALKKIFLKISHFQKYPQISKKIFIFPNHIFWQAENFNIFSTKIPNFSKKS
jgi:hypothetical protein